jgi:branched-chain amino acid transport system permease protein
VNVEELIQTLVNGLSLGSLYALIALGMTVVFGIMRLVNFAHGELLMIAGYALVLLVGVPLILLIVLTVAVVIVAAGAMERAAFRPVRNADPGTLLVTSFAVSFCLQNLAMIIFGSLPKSITFTPGLLESWQVGFLYIGKRDVLTVGLTIVLLTSLGLFLRRTHVGMQMRAAAEDFPMARLVGVRADRVVLGAFALSGLFAGCAGFLLVAQNGTVTPTMGLNVVLVGFVATVLGGLGSPLGAVVGGLVLGLITTLLQQYLPTDIAYYRDAFAYAAVIALLVVRPQGLIVPRATRNARVV